MYKRQGFGGTQRLARLVGMGMAKQLVYSALNIKADEALRIGLVNAVYTQEELMPAALKLAGKIAKNAPIAVRNCKKAINDGISPVSYTHLWRRWGPGP